MTTTHLFVELLVIGFGALIWLLILFAAITGTDVAALRAGIDGFLNRGAASGFVILLPIAYILGILVDRVADWVLERRDAEHRRQVFGDDLEFYFENRRALVLEGGALWEHLEYLRSRLRICRGWALNLFFILLFLNFYWLHLSLLGKSLSASPAVFLLLDFLLVVMLWLCLFSWKKMNLGEYKKTKRQAEWLESRKQMSNVSKSGPVAEVEPEAKEEESSGDAS